MSKASRLAALLIAGGLFAGAADAHALLLSFKIENGTALLQYNGRIDATRSRVSLLKEDGTLVKKLDVAAGQDLATITASLKDVEAGGYILRWEVLSVDGHLSRGDKQVTISAP